MSAGRDCRDCASHEAYGTAVYCSHEPTIVIVDTDLKHAGLDEQPEAERSGCGFAPIESEGRDVERDEYLKRR